MTARLLFTGGLTVLWLMLWGSVTPLAVVGGVLVATLAMVAFPFPTMTWDVTFRPWPFVVLTARFFADVLRASVQVAWLAVRPARPPRSAIVEVQLQTRSELVMTQIAEMISLVPGSLLVETDPDTGRLWLHVLDGHDEEAVAHAHRMAAEQERRVLRAFATDADLAENGHPEEAA
ncbi:Na+/H+ antiporter subunit E [Aeromicrobium sp. IC_218]|uniref:Na+/H+ antiporter subunit E n=1 Tax=Aeromicrobium sp. IC_218 TaxID=2545468 RepID=UPI00103C51EA|nr:Na+/H+ antiporter subunit E [Aeromicrobium sp. IC_218]TCI99157.1 Na+/H+ antiporter subunit E [Aeromicrobium sp. IC_218]